MGVRHKLNIASINGSLVIAAFAGIAASSWTFFLLVLLIGLATSLYAGSIRTNSRR